LSSPPEPQNISKSKVEVSASELAMRRRHALSLVQNELSAKSLSEKKRKTSGL